MFLENGVPLKVGKFLNPNVIEYDREDSLLPDRLWKKLGLYDEVGTIQKRHLPIKSSIRKYYALADVNDSGHYSLEKIADLLEKYPEAFFRYSK